MVEILFAGAGGQGVLTSGEIIAGIGIAKGLKATWSPEYGSAMRGGDANCTVKLTDGDMIYNPAREEPDIALAMNESSYNKFLNIIKPGGVVIVNSDMIDASKNMRDDIKVVNVPCLTLAAEINHPKGANIIMTGAIIKESGLFTEEEGLNAMNENFRKAGKERFEEANTKAFEIGYNFK